jgi:hypothetical protein
MWLYVSGFFIQSDVHSHQPNLLLLPTIPVNGSSCSLQPINPSINGICCCLQHINPSSNGICGCLPISITPAAMASAAASQPRRLENLQLILCVLNTSSICNNIWNFALSTRADGQMSDGLCHNPTAVAGSLMVNGRRGSTAPCYVKDGNGM